MDGRKLLNLTDFSILPGLNILRESRELVQQLVDQFEIKRTTCSIRPSGSSSWNRKLNKYDGKLVYDQLFIV